MSAALQGAAATLALEFWSTLAEMSPYLLMGFLVAGILSVVTSPAYVERHLGGRGVWPVVKAALFGVPLPLCSCGVIPVAASLRRHGATRGAATAFLLSTPQTGVDSILVTYSLLGPVMAVFRPIAALASGLIGGWFVDAVDRPAKSVKTESAVDARDDGEPGGGPKNRLARVFHYGYVVLPRDLARSLLVGLLAAAAISVFVPADFFRGAIGSGLPAMLLVMAVGIPLYVCATGSVPIAAAMIAKGVSPGVALVFLMTGPATNAAAVASVWKMMGRRVAIVYLLTVAVTALAFGSLFDAIVRGVSVSSTAACHSAMLPGWVGSGSAFVLLAVLGYALKPRRHAASVASGTGSPMVLRVRGMTCSHCADSVRRGLGRMPGIGSVDVDLGTGLVTVSAEGRERMDLVREIEALGYTVAPEGSTEGRG